MIVWVIRFPPNFRRLSQSPGLLLTPDRATAPFHGRQINLAARCGRSRRRRIRIDGLAKRSPSKSSGSPWPVQASRQRNGAPGRDQSARWGENSPAPCAGSGRRGPRVAVGPSRRVEKTQGLLEQLRGENQLPSAQGNGPAPRGEQPARRDDRNLRPLLGVEAHDMIADGAGQRPVEAGMKAAGEGHGPRAFIHNMN